MTKVQLFIIGFENKKIDNSYYYISYGILIIRKP